jgi:2,3-dihydroxybenzoate decarboxylase
MKKIGLEEHFVTPDLIPHLGETYQNINSSLAGRAVPHLQQLGNERIEAMEAGGLDFAVFRSLVPACRSSLMRAVR